MDQQQQVVTSEQQNLAPTNLGEVAALQAGNQNLMANTIETPVEQPQAEQPAPAQTDAAGQAQS